MFRSATLDTDCDLPSLVRLVRENFPGISELYSIGKKVPQPPKCSIPMPKEWRCKRKDGLDVGFLVLSSLMHAYELKFARGIRPRQKRSMGETEDDWAETYLFFRW